MKLPQTILTYPMTLASQAAHAVMRWQQGVAELVNKGDTTLESLFPPKDEQPEWATFDEDDDRLSDDEPDEVPRNGERLTEGRFALYSTGEPETREDKPVTKVSAAAPGIVAELDYESLTLAQLRARLPSVKLGDLESLLAFEESTKSRAPFQTLLANRITRATAK